MTLAVLVELLLYTICHQSETLTNHNYRKKQYRQNCTSQTNTTNAAAPAATTTVLLHSAKFNRVLFWSYFRSLRINPCSRHFMGPIPFLLLNQLHKSTRGNKNKKNSNIKTKQEKKKKNCPKLSTPFHQILQPVDWFKWFSESASTVTRNMPFLP